jgi:lysophospholipase L1-like esterase
MLGASAARAQDATSVAQLEGIEGASLAAFHAALARASRSEGVARVAFFGDSHAASDSLTGALRRALQARFGDAGPGFVLPVRAWPSYRAPSCEVTSGGAWRALRVVARDRHVDRYGLAGVAVECAPREATEGSEADDGLGWGELQLPESVAGAEWRVELWAAAQPGGGTLSVRLDDADPVETPLAAPDWQPRYLSLAASAGPAHRLRLDALGDGAVRLFGAVVERRSSGVVIDTLGLNGARARDQLSWDDALFREQLARRRHDLVVLEYGTNESGDDDTIARYEASLRQVVARVRDAAPTASCLLVGPTDRPLRVRRVGWVARARQAEIVDVQRRVALESGCAFFDTVRFQGGPLATAAWARLEPPLAQRDHIHLTRLGYVRVGEALAAALAQGVAPSQ